MIKKLKNLINVRNKQLTKPAVINRRELLLAFLQYLDKDKPQSWFTHEPIVNDFLSKQ